MREVADLRLDERVQVLQVGGLRGADSFEEKLCYFGLAVEL